MGPLLAARQPSEAVFRLKLGFQAKKSENLNYLDFDSCAKFQSFSLACEYRAPPPRHFPLYLAQVHTAFPAEKLSLWFSTEI